MANLNANQTAAKNSNNVNAFIFHNNPKCIKLKYNTVNKNHTLLIILQMITVILINSQFSIKTYVEYPPKKLMNS